MIKSAQIVLMSLVMIGSLQAKHRDQDWQNRKMADLESARTIADIHRKIEVLAEQLRLAGDPPPDAFQQHVYAAIQDELLAIPGYAAYFDEKLEAARSRAKSTEGDRDEQDIRLLEYRDVQTEVSILGSLPSAESVAVLGKYVTDPEGRDGMKINGEVNTGRDGFELNCILAMRQLNRIGIGEPPVPRTKPKGKEDHLLYVERWQDWWNEVKAGKRTYRFTGSPVEYGPDGPVSKDKLAEIQRGEKRNENRLAGKRKSGGAAAGTEGSTEKPFPFAMVSAGVAGVLAAGWYLLKIRKAS